MDCLQISNSVAGEPSRMVCSAHILEFTRAGYYQSTTDKSNNCCYCLFTTKYQQDAVSSLSVSLCYHQTVLFIDMMFYK